jgi:hypothetical protein
VAECRKRIAGEKSQAKRASEDGSALLTAYSANIGNDDKWYVDSGATQHLSSKKEWLDDYQDITPRNIYLADNRVIVAKGIGKVHVKLEVNGRMENGTLYEVLYVPDLHGNLLSVNKIVARGHKVIFNDSVCLVEDQSGRAIAVATKDENLYRLAATIPEVYDMAHLAKVPGSSMDLWHQRMGHLGVDSIRQMVAKGLVTGLDLS